MAPVSALMEAMSDILDGLPWNYVGNNLQGMNPKALVDSLTFPLVPPKWQICLSEINENIGWITMKFYIDMNVPHGI